MSGKEPSEGPPDRRGRPPAKKTDHDILSEEIELGLAEIRRSKKGLFLSGLSAGLDLGFGPFLMAVLLTRDGGALPPPVLDLALAGLYSVGFILVVFGRSELFTEHTTLSILPVLARRSSVARLLRLWATVYSANLVGAAVFAWIAAVHGPAMGVIGRPALQEIALRMVGQGTAVTLLSAVLAGWLMGLVSWLTTAGRDTTAQILFVLIVTGAIGLGRFHHCIAGTIEVLPAVMLGLDVSLADYGHFLLWTTLGNAVGGVIFVALLKYAHAVLGEPGPS